MQLCFYTHGFMLWYLCCFYAFPTIIHYYWVTIIIGDSLVATSSVSWTCFSESNGSYNKRKTKQNRGQRLYCRNNSIEGILFWNFWYFPKKAILKNKCERLLPRISEILQRYFNWKRNYQNTINFHFNFQPPQKRDKTQMWPKRMNPSNSFAVVRLTQFSPIFYFCTP